LSILCCKPRPAGPNRTRNRRLAKRHRSATRQKSEKANSHRATARRGTHNCRKE
jgi:hypothetical protein